MEKGKRMAWVYTSGPNIGIYPSTVTFCLYSGIVEDYDAKYILVSKTRGHLAAYMTETSPEKITYTTLGRRDELLNREEIKEVPWPESFHSGGKESIGKEATLKGA